MLYDMNYRGILPVMNVRIAQVGVLKSCPGAARKLGRQCPPATDNPCAVVESLNFSKA